MTVYASPDPGDGGPTEVYAVEDGVSLASLTDITPETAEVHAGVEPLDPRADLINKSPSGFAWGYSGSGPRQLAVAVLAHAGGDEFALEHSYEFKEAAVSEQDGDEPLRLTDEDIRSALGIAELPGDRE